MKISIDGGEPVRVMEQPATFPAISPDGIWLAYGFRNEETGEWLTGVMPFEGGQVAHVFENQGPPIGWSPDNNKWAESLHPEDAPGLLAKWERAYKHGEPYTGECRFKAKDGSYKTVTFIDTPFEMNLAK